MEDLIIVIPIAVLMFVIGQVWVNFALKEYVKRCKQEYKDSTND